MNLSLFQYISFTTIGKDPKDPSLVSNKLANTIGGCSHIMSVGKNDRNCSNICLDISPHFRWGAHGTLGAVPLAHSMRPQEVCCLPQHNYPQDQSIRNSSSFSLTSHWSRPKEGVVGKLPLGGSHRLSVRLATPAVSLWPMKVIMV